MSRGSSTLKRVPVTINWTKADDTVDISIAPDAVNGKVGIQLEAGEMGDGGSVDVGTGGISDTDVDINK